MNATRAITARGRAAGHTALYSIGRVQTPTLAMLVRREREIQEFVPRDYWEIRAELRTAGGQTFTAGWRHGDLTRLASAALAEAIVERDRAHGGAAEPLGPRVERLRARTVREPAPLLFDLTSLQRTANRRFGLSAARTLEVAQALYERHKLLTYPRTDSRHLSSDMATELPGLFAALGAVPAYAAFAGELVAHPPRPGRRVVDDAKVHDHHAIIPTGKTVGLEALDRDERRLFDLVVRRFLGVFYPDAEFAITEAWIRVGAAGGVPPREPEEGRGRRADDDARLLETLPPLPDRYLARGRVRVAAGWQAVAGIDGGDDTRARDKQEGAAESSALLPPLVEGQALDGRFTPVAKQTTPPARYTEATLLGAMESAGTAIDDEALRAAMKDTGLGTPATRASIIETLLRRDYVVRAKQHLDPDPGRDGPDRDAARGEPRLAGADGGVGSAARADRARGGVARDVHGGHRAVRRGHGRRDPRLEPGGAGHAGRPARAGAALPGRPDDGARGSAGRSGLAGVVEPRRGRGAEAGVEAGLGAGQASRGGAAWEGGRERAGVSALPRGRADRGRPGVGVRALARRLRLRGLVRDRRAAADRRAAPRSRDARQDPQGAVSPRAGTRDRGAPGARARRRWRERAVRAQLTRAGSACHDRDARRGVGARVDSPGARRGRARRGPRVASMVARGSRRHGADRASSRGLAVSGGRGLQVSVDPADHPPVA